MLLLSAKTYILGALMITLCNQVIAQNSATKETVLEADIRFFSWAIGTEAGELGDVIEEAQAEFRLLTDGKLQRLRVPSGRVSDPITYKGSPQLSIYPPWVDTLELAKETPPLWTFSTPSGIESLIILMIPKNREKSAFQFQPVNTSIERIPPGHILFENVGQRPLALKLNNLLKPIEPRGFYLLDMNEITGSFLSIQVAAQHVNGWEKVVESKRRINQELRYLMLVHPNVNSKSYGMVPMVLRQL